MVYYEVWTNCTAAYKLPVAIWNGDEGEHRQTRGKKQAFHLLMYLLFENQWPIRFAGLIQHYDSSIDTTDTLVSKS